MCFSAGASFTAGTLLTFAGTETLRKVHKPSQIVFASIPLFFAFQQFAEGVLWLVVAKKKSSRLGDNCYILFFDNGPDTMAADCAIFRFINGR